MLTADRCVIHNCPALSDTALTIRILRTLGCRADWRQGNIFVDSSDLSHLEISGSLTGKMRSSIVFLGPLLAWVAVRRLLHILEDVGWDRGRLICIWTD